MADIQRVLVETEDFLARQVGTSARRSLTSRRIKRGVGEAMRRVRRAGIIFLVLLFGLILFSAAVSPLGWAWLLAIPGTFIAALLSLMWPTRGRRAAPSPDEASQKVASMPLPALAGRCEQWLLDRTADLPRDALDSADTILARLSSLQPHVADLPEGNLVGGEVRRLVGGHLPRLVDSYLALPPAERHARSESSRRLVESLAVVADELTRLCGEVEGCRTSQFETEHRFIETRYKDGGLRGD